MYSRITASSRPTVETKNPRAQKWLLLRADDENRPDYEVLGVGPFRPYEGKDHSMPFFAVPDEVMDDPEELLEWAGKSIAATLRMKSTRKKR